MSSEIVESPLSHFGCCFTELTSQVQVTRAMKSTTHFPNGYSAPSHGACGTGHGPIQFSRLGMAQTHSIHFVTTMLLLAISCEYRPYDEGATRLSHHADWIEWTGNLELEERANVTTVAISVESISHRRFLIADQQEVQVRVYDLEGNLDAFFAPGGEDQGKLQTLSTAIEMPTGGYFVIASSSRAALHDETGRLKRTYTLPIVSVYSAAVIGLDSIVIGGRLASGGDEILHIFELQTGKIVRSFLRPALKPLARRASTFAGFVDIAVRGDTIAALFAFTDSIYLFSKGGVFQTAIPIPARGYRSLSQRPPRRMDRLAAMEWATTFSIYSYLYWLENGHFLIQYQDRKELEPVWSTVLLDRWGTWLNESANTPMILTIRSPEDDHQDAAEDLYFVRPGAFDQHLWTRATIR